LKLRQATIIIVAVTFLLLILVLSLSLQSVLTDYFKNEEQQLNTVNLQRVLAAFENNFTILNYLANDWSHWNDTYQFVQDGNIEFIRSNLVEETFQELNCI
jgi:sensor domain CHASE-containing protein